MQVSAAAHTCSGPLANFASEVQAAAREALRDELGRMAAAKPPSRPRRADGAKNQTRLTTELSIPAPQLLQKGSHALPPAHPKAADRISTAAAS
jgi:hypothetical protein